MAAFDGAALRCVQLRSCHSAVCDGSRYKSVEHVNDAAISRNGEDVGRSLSM